MRVPMDEARSDSVLDVVFACDGVMQCMTQYQMYLPKLPVAFESAVVLQRSTRMHQAMAPMD